MGVRSLEKHFDPVPPNPAGDRSNQSKPDPFVEGFHRLHHPERFETKLIMVSVFYRERVFILEGDYSISKFYAVFTLILFCLPWVPEKQQVWGFGDSRHPWKEKSYLLSNTAFSATLDSNSIQSRHRPHP